jgi:hypothetical protein
MTLLICLSSNLHDSPNGIAKLIGNRQQTGGVFVKAFLARWDASPFALVLVADQLGVRVDRQAVANFAFLLTVPTGRTASWTHVDFQILHSSLLS